MPRPTNPADLVDIALVDGSRLKVPAVLASRVRGIDADGDVLVPLGDPDDPIRHADGSENLVALTPCCHASGKGAESATGVVCRGCYREVHHKYACDGTLAVARA